VFPGAGMSGAGSGGSPAIGGGAGGAVTSGGAGASMGGGTAGAGGQALGGAGLGGGGAGGGGAGGGGPLRIMPLGDSITVGGPARTNAGYRGFLYNLLKQSGRDVLFVGSSVYGIVTTTVNPLPMDQRHNEGHSSYTINDVNNNLDGLDTATFERFGGADRDPNGGHWLDGIASGADARPPVFPDIVTLMIGTNNAGGEPATVDAQLHALLTKLTTLRPNTQVIVAQITPSNRTFDVSYNAFVATEVASLQAAGKHVSLVDMYTNFPANGLSMDNLHPNDTGFAFMAQQWFDAIAKLTVARNPPRLGMTGT
jgi:lysophospholipase L1-like esterase